MRSLWRICKCLSGTSTDWVCNSSNKLLINRSGKYGRREKKRLTSKSVERCWTCSSDAMACSIFWWRCSWGWSGWLAGKGDTFNIMHWSSFWITVQSVKTRGKTDSYQDSETIFLIDGHRYGTAVRMELESPRLMVILKPWRVAFITGGIKRREGVLVLHDWN